VTPQVHQLAHSVWYTTVTFLKSSFNLKGLKISNLNCRPYSLNV